MDMSSKVGNIYQWEISGGKSTKDMKKLNQVRHIHLLKDDAWDDKAPNKLIQKSMNIESENKRIVYIGLKPTVAPTVTESTVGAQKSFIARMSNSVKETAAIFCAMGLAVMDAKTLKAVETRTCCN